MKLKLAAVLLVTSFGVHAQSTVYTQKMHDHTMKVMIEEMDASGVTQKLSELSGKSAKQVRRISENGFDRCMKVYINKDASLMGDAEDAKIEQCFETQMLKGFGIDKQTLVQWEQVLESDDSLQTPEEQEIAALEAEMEQLFEKDDLSEKDMEKLKQLQKKQTELMIKMAQKYQAPE
ncbi:hypothetical protein VST7929_01036 [Vibrio stylophorae]|uniref:Uncharacterized protein n=1 Tax=Vibrio stylophorae TaxID=659351 RepID=A0ABM8ZSR1_9VIBR|nr:hypothetical protein [Vibrio stylophorae]CAH0533174.1 hypothetical protein VST7929_01036 [Vibrio stylophorae]